MQSGGIFEAKLCGGLLALGGDFTHERVALGVEERAHSVHFLGVLLIAATLEAWSKAHLHFRIDTAGKSRVRIQIIHAAAHFEEIQRVVGKLLRGRARWERSVVVRVITPYTDCN